MPARAWILLPEDVKKLRQNVKTVPGISLAHAFNLTTYDGGQAQMSDNLLSGATIDLLPRVSGHSLNLLLGATSTEGKQLRGTTLEVITNLTASCRVFLPNGGALVVDSGNRSNSSQTNYWLIVSPMAIDSRGQPKPL